jgi:hypothetical protein
MRGLVALPRVLLSISEVLQDLISEVVGLFPLHIIPGPWQVFGFEGRALSLFAHLIFLQFFPMEGRLFEEVRPVDDILPHAFAEDVMVGRADILVP